eukprot:373891_1
MGPDVGQVRTRQELWVVTQVSSPQIQLEMPMALQCHVPCCSTTESQIAVSFTHPARRTFTQPSDTGVRITRVARTDIEHTIIAFLPQDGSVFGTLALSSAVGQRPTEGADCTPFTAVISTPHR